MPRYLVIPFAASCLIASSNASFAETMHLTCVAQDTPVGAGHVSQVAVDVDNRSVTIRSNVILPKGTRFQKEEIFADGKYASPVRSFKIEKNERLDQAERIKVEGHMRAGLAMKLDSRVSIDTETVTFGASADGLSKEGRIDVASGEMIYANTRMSCSVVEEQKL